MWISTSWVISPRRNLRIHRTRMIPFLESLGFTRIFWKEKDAQESVFLQIWYVLLRDLRVYGILVLEDSIVVEEQRRPTARNVERPVSWIYSLDTKAEQYLLNIILLCYYITILLYYCITVLLYYYITILLYYYITILLY